MNFEYFPLTQNRCFTVTSRINPKGIMLHSVGCAQPSPEVFAKKWNSQDCTIGLHGIIGPEKCYQFMPWNYRGWHAGSGTKGSANDTHIGVEMTEPATIKYTGGANFIDLNPEASEKHVKACYDNAVAYFAKVCKEYGFNPETAVISHSEGHTRGIASNHGDVAHLWKMYPSLGYTMDRFRKEVKEAMQEPKQGSGDNPSGYAVEATRWAIEKGLFIGDAMGNYNWLANLTREQAAVILYRLKDILK